MNVNNWGPFNAEVWGTVSDWAMVAVTALTAYFLVKTFSSQQKVQMLQQTMTDIEKERYRVEYLPKFEIAAANVNNATDGKTIRSTVHFKLKLIAHEAKGLKVTDRQGTGIIEQISISIAHIGQNMPVPVVHATTEFDLYFIILPNTALFPQEGCYFFFAVSFRDSLGNEYEQLCSTVFKDTILSFFAGQPELNLHIVQL